jgi:uncharacterized protein (TIGR00725 family)
VVAVVGPGGDIPADIRDPARRIGFLLARRGVVVVTGGLGGVMAAASRGVRDGGGLVVGLSPNQDYATADDLLSVAIATGLGQARNALVVAAADGVISVGGSWGTLSEIALARRAGKPVVCLHGWRVADATGEEVPLTTGTSADDAVARLAEALRWAPGAASPG